MLQLKCYVFMCTDTSPVWVLIHLYTWGAAFRMWTWLLWFVCCPVFVHCPAFWMLTLLLHWFQSSFNKSTPLSTVNHLSHVPHLRSLYFLLLAQQFPCQIPASLMPSQFYSYQLSPDTSSHPSFCSKGCEQVSENFSVFLLHCLLFSTLTYDTLGLVNLVYFLGEVVQRLKKIMTNTKTNLRPCK